MKHHLDLKHIATESDGELVPSGPQAQTTIRLDLRQLAVHRDGIASGEKAACAPRRRISLLARYVVPGGLLLGFAVLMAWAARASLLPSRPVTVMPVLISQTEAQQLGTPLFQAAGWVEPRPTPIVVPALAEGVVERLLVVEGQEVKAGEPVAYLIDIDAKLALREAEAELWLREADLAKARANLASARSRFMFPVHLQAQLSEAEAALSKVWTESATLPAKLEAAEAHLRFARLDLEGKMTAKAALSQRAVDLAQSELDSAIATVRELQIRKQQL